MKKYKSINFSSRMLINFQGPKQISKMLGPYCQVFTKLGRTQYLMQPAPKLIYGQGILYQISISYVKWFSRYCAGMKIIFIPIFVKFALSRNHKFASFFFSFLPKAFLHLDRQAFIYLMLVLIAFLS